MIFVEFLVRNLFTMIALWDGALSWYKIHEFSFHKFDLFRRIYSLKRFITLKYYSLFTVWPSGKNSECTTPPWFLLDFDVVFSVQVQLSLLSFWRKFRSFGTSRAATRFIPKQSFKIVEIDSWDTESSTAISIKFKWRFSVTISFTLAMLTSVFDSVFLINSIHRKPSVTFSAIPHTKFHLQCKIWDKFFVRYSYTVEKSRNTLEIFEWSIPGTSFTEYIINLLIFDAFNHRKVISRPFLNGFVKRP